MSDVHGEAGHDLVCFGYLLLDDEPAVGKHGRNTAIVRL